jgi:Domain of Unknown Function with PDB structure (DUF3857)/Transglutaminase-like superfamily
LTPFLLSTFLMFANPEAPGWLKEAATAELPKYEAKVPAAVLLNEEVVTVQDGGAKTHSIRYAVKVLNREGASAARRGIDYFSGAGKVRDAKAWLIPPSGKVREYGKNDVLDVNFVNGVYDESRTTLISARSDADPGSVFGFEATLDEKTVFSQFRFDFQEDLPSLRSFFTLNLPAGWKAEGKLLNGAGLVPQISGNSYHWQLTTLAPYDREPNSPERESINPSLVVSTFPPEGSAGGLAGHFETWKDVSAWTSRLVEPSGGLTAELDARVKTLTAGTSTFWDKLRALADDAQKIRYISIQLNLARGGGYTPHPAASVLRNGYGDCKDKANYLRTLLKSAGIESYLVTIYSGDPRHTKREWPSPEQFNHAILAIRVPDDTKVPAAFDFPALGRMVLFDPTDDIVPLGFVPDHEQKSLALLLAGDKGDLFETPSSVPSANLLKRTAHLKLTGDGDLSSALIEDAGIGQAAFDSIDRHRHMTSSEYTRSVEARVGRRVTGAKVTKVEATDDPSREQFRMNVEFTAPAYASLMQGRLMMFKPAVLPYLGGPDVTSTKRKHPLVVDPVAYQEHVEVELPDGFAIDELPTAESLESPYGKFSASWKVSGSTLVFDRQLELKASLVPVAEYKAARDFFGALGGTELAPVVLVKK